MRHLIIGLATAASLAGATTAAASAQAPQTAAAAAPALGAGVALLPVPDGYRIGPDDVLNVAFWKDKDMSADVTVRPDGRVTLPLVNDVMAGGFTPEELRERIALAAKKFIATPNVTVTVKQINSRKAFITGQIEKPGAYNVGGKMTVVQMIAMAGGFREFAKLEKIFILRVREGREVTYQFNYEAFVSRKNLAQNIELQPGDTIVVP